MNSHTGKAYSSDGKPGSVWTIIRESEKRLTIQIINLTGNNSNWNEPKHDPDRVEDIIVRILQDREIKGIWAASPDDLSLFILPRKDASI